VKEPLEALKVYYEECESAYPSRPLVSPGASARLIAKRLISLAFAAMGPLCVGGAIALVVLFASSAASPEDKPSAAPMFERQMKQAGLNKSELLFVTPSSHGHSEIRSWHA